MCNTGNIRSHIGLLDGESVCLLTDICVEREYFYVADNENRRVKRFRNSDNGFQDHILLNDPCGICKLFLSSHIVITEPSDRHLTYVSVEGSMILSSRRKTSKKYGAIRCLDETRLVVGCSELANASVDILDYTGKVLQSINSNKNELSLFLTPACLACYNEKYIIVSDSGTRNVTCISKSGKIEWVIELKCSPSGVCITKSGTIFICLYEENKIITVDSIHNGAISGSLENIEIKNPLAITYAKGCIYLTEEMPSDKILQIQIDGASDHGNEVALTNIHLIMKNERALTDSVDVSTDAECL